MKIIDIHAHVYDKIAGITNGVPMVSREYGKVAIGNKIKRLLPPCFTDSTSPAELLLEYMDYDNVDKAILMANPFYGYHNDYVDKVVKKYPDKFKGVALVDVLKGREAADELADIYENTSLIGMKIEVGSTFQCAPQTRLTDEKLQPVWDCCNQTHQPVFLHLFRDEDVVDMKVLAENYPQIKFVLCHLGADSSFRKWNKKSNFDEILELVRKQPNVWADTSTVPDYYTEEYPFPTSLRHIQHAWKVVGPEKLMWASDYPGMLNYATYKQLIDIILNGCDEIPYSHKELIMGENADQIFFK